MTPGGTPDRDASSRRQEVAAGLAAVRERITGACSRAGRDPGEVSLVVVTKFFPASDVRLLADLGVTDVGENRHQEAAAKAAECADLAVRWHFIGSIQGNKAAAIAGYADVVESVDRVKVADGLDRGAQQRGRVVDCLVQVSLDPEGTTGRGGVHPDRVGEVAEAIQRSDALRLRGLMAVAPLGSPARAAFERLAGIAERLRAEHPAADVLSAGMSNDFEDAIACGATHVRIGSAILGKRPGLL